MATKSGRWHAGMKKSPLAVIFFTVFLDLVGFGIIIPLSPYLAREFGASAFEVGLLMAVYSGMQFLFSPFWGGISDRVGRRPVLLVSIAGTAIAHTLFYFADHLWLLFAARLLAGAFSANISTAMAYIADITPAQDRSRNMGLIGAAFGLGFVLGPAIAGLLAHFGENFPALAAAFLSLLNFTLAVFVLDESLSEQSRRQRPRGSRLRSIAEKMQRPVVGSLLFAQFAIGLAMANMEASLFLYMQDRFGWGVRQSSYGFAYVGICIAFTQGYLVRKYLPESWKDKSTGQKQERTEWHANCDLQQAGRDRGRVPAQGQQGLRRRLDPYPQVAGQGRRDQYTTEIVASEMQMLDSRGGGSGGGGRDDEKESYGAEPRQSAREAQPQPAAVPGDWDDDIPF
jgi:multidrug resistance protein